jgi:hypothetical protein
MIFVTWHKFCPIWKERSNQKFCWQIDVLSVLKKKDCKLEKMMEKSILSTTCEWMNKTNWKNHNKNFFKINWRWMFRLWNFGREKEKDNWKIKKNVLKLKCEIFTIKLITIIFSVNIDNWHRKSSCAYFWTFFVYQKNNPKFNALSNPKLFYRKSNFATKIFFLT